MSDAVGRGGPVGGYGRRVFICSFLLGVFLFSRTLRIQHLLDGAGDVGGVAADDEFEAVV